MTNEQLVARIRAHDNESENMLLLWQQNKNMIKKIAIKYTYASDLEDLEQEGYFGLCQAVANYEPERGVLFLSYATYWIQQVISRYVDNCCSGVRIPSYAVDGVRKYKRTIAEFEKYNGYKPTEYELKTLLGVSWKELQVIKENALKTNIDSLDRTIDSGVGDASVGDSISSGYDLEESIIDKLDHERMSEELWTAVDSLPADQGEAIKKKYVDDMTYKEIGDQNDVSLHAIRTRVDNGLRRLRSGRHTKSLRMYYNEFFPTVSVKYKGVGAFNRDWTSVVEREVLIKLKKQTGR